MENSVERILPVELHNKVLQFHTLSCHYISHKDYCYTISISKDEIYHHFHVYPLSSNFIQTRTITQCDTTSIITKLPFSKRGQIATTINNETSELFKMLKHYGLYKSMYHLAQITSSNTDHFDDFLRSMTAMEIIHEKPFLFSRQRITSIMYATECIGLNNFKYDLTIFNYFTQFYVVNHMLSPISDESIRQIRCKCYLNNMQICNICLHHDNINRMCLGYLLIFSASIIHFKLKQIRSHKFKQNLKIFFIHFAAWTNVEKTKFDDLYNRCNAIKLRRYTIAELRNVGRQYVSCAHKYMLYQRSKNMLLCNDKNEIAQFQDEADYFYFLSRIYFNDKQYDIAKVYFVMAVCGEKDELYQRVVSLEALSINCYVNKEYLIGMKVLRCCYKLSNGYF
eukprot:70206_1